MAMAVESANADPLALIPKSFEIIAVGVVARRHQTLALSEGFRLVDELPLLLSADGNLAFSPALGPGSLEYQSIATIGPLRDDLDSKRSSARM